jgi:S-adenosylmethionine:tRNA ribosyltransferase-isomerase
MLLTADLDFKFPEELIATHARPRGTSRILKISRTTSTMQEITWQNLLATIRVGDTLVLNDSQVLWARLRAKKTTGKEGEVFFLRTLSSTSHWRILSKGLKLSLGEKIFLPPGDLQAEVVAVGRTSEIKISRTLDLQKYFKEFGDVPLPPYITNLRGDHKQTDAERSEDEMRYQNEWAKVWGSVAAPTAGLHFSNQDLEHLKAQGVKIAYVTLHVGAGTFLPLDTEKLNDFQIHEEVVNVDAKACATIRQSQAAGKKIWACGTTALRAIESAVWASGTAESNLPMITPFYGETRLFITPGYKFRCISALLTNFHQPQSSLLALVAAFATEKPPQSEEEKKLGVQKILRAYHFAIQKRFKLFSFGDLTVMI